MDCVLCLCCCVVIKHKSILKLNVEKVEVRKFKVLGFGLAFVWLILVKNN